MATSSKNNPNGFAPRFCPKHLKIHICEEMNITNQLKNVEAELGAKVRKLHGTQTEEEIEAEAKKSAPQAGTIGAILAQAKAKIAEQKKHAIDDEINSQAKVVSQDEVNDRMAALRARMSGESDDGSAPTPSSLPQRPTGGLGDVIEHARTTISNQTWAEYKVPERSRMGESDETVATHDDTAYSPNATTKHKKTKVNNDTKKPAIAFEKTTNDIVAAIEDDLESLTVATEIDASQPHKKKRYKKNSKPKIAFTVEETQELIQQAVTKALSEAGLIQVQKAKAPHSSTTKKSAAPKVTTKKATSTTSKSSSAKKTSTNAKTSKSTKK